MTVENRYEVWAEEKLRLKFHSHIKGKRFGVRIERRKRKCARLLLIFVVLKS